MTGNSFAAARHAGTRTAFPHPAQNDPPLACRFAAAFVKMLERLVFSLPPPPNNPYKKAAGLLQRLGCFKSKIGNQ